MNIELSGSTQMLPLRDGVENDMIRAVFYVKDIDYQMLIDTMMPYIEKGLTKKDNPASDLFSKLISKNGKPTKFSNFMVSLIPKKDEMVACLMPHFDEVLIQYLNSMLSDHGIPAKVTGFKTDSITRKQESLLRFVVVIDSIDYEAAAQNLLPTLLSKLMEKQDSAGRIGHLLFGMKELPAAMVKAAIAAIPPLQRDDIAAAVLTEYREDLRKYLNEVIIRKEIKASIRKIKIESVISDITDDRA